MTEPKVIPHQKPPKKPRPYKEPKPKRYAVEKFIHEYKGSEPVSYWYEVQDFHFAFNAKSYARIWEEHQPYFKWRVVDRKGLL